MFNTVHLFSFKQLDTLETIYIVVCLLFVSISGGIRYKGSTCLSTVTRYGDMASPRLQQDRYSPSVNGLSGLQQVCIVTTQRNS